MVRLRFPADSHLYDNGDACQDSHDVQSSVGVNHDFPDVYFTPESLLLLSAMHESDLGETKMFRCMCLIDLQALASSETFAEKRRTRCFDFSRLPSYLLERTVHGTALALSRVSKVLRTGSLTMNA